MTDKLYCPFCHRALARHGVQCKEYGACRGENCPSGGNFLLIEIWQALINGKKAQEDLKYVKEELKCAKHNYSVLSEQKEIAYQNYLKITGDLQTQLQKAQDALNRAISEITDLCTTILYCSGEADNEIQMIQMRDEMVEEAKARIFGEITSITKGESNE